MNLAYIFNFLNDLATHNSKEWMTDNKDRYQSSREFFISMVTDVIEQAKVFDAELESIEPKKTLFRINRDVRFSNNKDPYKTNFGASITPGGKKTGMPGYYIHLKPGDNHIGGGIYQPESSVLAKIRQEIDYNGDQLKAIIEDKDFKNFYGEPYGERLKTAPKGYPKDHEYIHLLQLKHHVFMTNIDAERMTCEEYVSKAVEGIRLMQPYRQFLKEALD